MEDVRCLLERKFRRAEQWTMAADALLGLSLGCIVFQWYQIIFVPESSTVVAALSFGVTLLGSVLARKQCTRTLKEIGAIFRQYVKGEGS